ncbi:MAG: FKBP-type peptidyl-prolyl cis-trans isomerase [Crocinitomicaceae bacterium]|nr:FKBP-type peptidyl-prolyl cis-trans isomerase [Flavobacteriales bacterium]NQZ35417.1 FKBP-type peptidyl-prolyl cis-trans isomerase [Crocinitomicaceae bacterium]
MKNLLLIGLIPAMLFGFASCGDDEAEVVIEKIEFQNTKEKLSYALGVESAVGLFKEDSKFEALDKNFLVEGFNSNISNSSADDCQATIQKFLGPQGQDFDTTYLKEGSTCIGRMSGYYFYMQMDQMGQLSDLDLEMVKKGFMQGVYGQDTTNLSVLDRVQVLKEFGEKLQGNFESDIKAKDDIFWADVMTKPNVEQIGQTGVYLETIKKGSGGKPDVASDFEANYILTNALGDTLESSYVSGAALKMNLSGVIRGWQIGFPAMNKGGQYRLFVPYEQAYKGGNPQAPQGALCFYVDLINYGPAGSIATPRQRY